MVSNKKMPNDNNQNTNNNLGLGGSTVPAVDPKPAEPANTTPSPTPNQQTTPPATPTAEPSIQPASSPTPAPILPMGVDVAPPPPMDHPPSPIAAPTGAPEGDKGSPDGTKPKKEKKKMGKKTLGAIIGVLVLVGGITAGAVLVRQQQDIREKAYNAQPQPCLVCSGTSCVSSGILRCNGGDNDCSNDYDCGYVDPLTDDEVIDIFKEEKKEEAKDREDTSSTTTDTANTCGRVTSTGGDANSISITLSSDQVNSCTNPNGVCPNGIVVVNEYRCDEINLTGGCQSNGRLVQRNAGADDYSTDDPSCGSVQIDAGCQNAYGTGGLLTWASKSASTPCTTTSTPPDGEPPGLTAQCIEVLAFNESGTKLTATELALLNEGDTIVLAVRGNTSKGQITKARFRINGTQRPEVVTKQNIGGVEYFADIYTIPSGVTQFSIGGQIFHSTAGWF